MTVKAIGKIIMNFEEFDKAVQEKKLAWGKLVMNLRRKLNIICQRYKFIQRTLLFSPNYPHRMFHQDTASSFFFKALISSTLEEVNVMERFL